MTRFPNRVHATEASGSVPHSNSDANKLSLSHREQCHLIGGVSHCLRSSHEHFKTITKSIVSHQRVIIPNKCFRETRPTFVCASPRTSADVLDGTINCIAGGCSLEEQYTSSQPHQQLILPQKGNSATRTYRAMSPESKYVMKVFITRNHKTLTRSNKLWLPHKRVPPPPQQHSTLYLCLFKASNMCGPYLLWVNLNRVMSSNRAEAPSPYPCDDSINLLTHGESGTVFICRKNRLTLTNWVQCPTRAVRYLVSTSYCLRWIIPTFNILDIFNISTYAMQTSVFFHRFDQTFYPYQQHGSTLINFLVRIS